MDARVSKAATRRRPPGSRDPERTRAAILAAATENLNRASYLKKSRRIRDLHSPLVGMISALLERGAKDGTFRKGVDPVQLYISIAALGFFYFSNRYTLSTIFARDFAARDELAERGKHIVDVVLGYLQPPTGC